MIFPNPFTRLRSMLQSASRLHVSPQVEPNAGPVYGRARVVARPSQVDAPTVPLPLNGRGYTSQLHPNARAYNRADVVLPRRGTARKAVGL